MKTEPMTNGKTTRQWAMSIRKKEKTLKKRLRLKKFKQLLQDDMLANVWDGSYQDKRRIVKMSHFQMIKELNEEWLNQTGYPRIMDFD